MLDLMSSYWKSQAIYVVAHLGLADLVKDGPRSADDLASATGTHAPSLYRLLRALASEGVFVEQSDRRFALTPLAECLLSDSPMSQRSLAMMMGEEHYHTWAELLYSIRTGKTAFDRRYGKPIFDYLTTNPRAAQLFDAAMTGVHGAETAAMVAAYDFGGIGTLVDIGGGNGSLISTVLKAYPSLRGILYDLPHVVERAKPNLQAAGLADRCQALGGDFFREVPAGADAYLMRHIIHDWDEEKCLTILGNCRRVMGPKARLLVIEMVIPPGNDPHFGKWLDVNMLVIPGGQERTESEYRELFRRAGFTLARVVPTRSPVSVLEGLPA
jgi:hypothetical protein